MKSIDLKALRKANNLTQSELGDYLGCTKAFISTLEKGNRPLPNEMYSKLINNLLNWDISMLSQAQSNVVSEAMPVQEDTLIAELRSQIEKLQAKVDNLNQELGEKNALIKFLRNEGVESV